MTPFELSLRNELEVEWQRFDGEWLFKWHGMTYEGGVTDVDDFRGGRIRYGGILFGDQQQQIFWEALSRYLNQKVHDVFKQWDVETRGYPAPVRLRSIEGLELILTGFAQQIVGRAVDTDRRLRGGGYPESVRPYNSGGSVRAIAEISRLAAAHRTLIDEIIQRETVVPVRMSRKEKVEEFLSNHKGIMAAIGLLIAALGLARYFFG